MTRSTVDTPSRPSVHACTKDASAQATAAPQLTYAPGTRAAHKRLTTHRCLSAPTHTCAGCLCERARACVSGFWVAAASATATISSVASSTRDARSCLLRIHTGAELCRGRRTRVFPPGNL
eukprot:6020378-Pleurochrysis_carterae.AAC.1